jgi:wyosine [tRNA(Phe)-imidazoG37] synthetase (radical SAM superfamily)
MLPDIFPKGVEVLSAVERLLSKPRTIRYLTFSGNGEPTLHPDFLDITKGIREIIRKSRSEVRLALFTNGSTIKHKEMFISYRLIDNVMVKLDAGDPMTFNKINRPCKGIDFSELVEGLMDIPQLTIQSCLLDGIISNIKGDANAAWCRMLETLAPKAVQIYSIDRPTSKDFVRRVSPEQLEKISNELNASYGLNTNAFWRR